MNLHNLTTEELINEAQRTDNRLAIAITKRLESKDLTAIALQTIADSITTRAQEQCIKDCRPGGFEYQSACDYLVDGITADMIERALRTLLEEIDAPRHQVNICKPFDADHLAVELLERLLKSDNDFDALADQLHDGLVFHTDYDCAPSCHNDIFLDSYRIGELEIELESYIEDLPDQLREPVSEITGQVYCYSPDVHIDMCLSAQWLAAWLKEYYA